MQFTMLFGISLVKLLEERSRNVRDGRNLNMLVGMVPIDYFKNIQE